MQKIYYNIMVDREEGPTVLARTSSRLTAKEIEEHFNVKFPEMHCWIEEEKPH